MTVHTISRAKLRRKAHGVLMLPTALLVALVLAAGSFVAYVLWPTWPGKPVPLDAPAIPITVGGVLFDIPPAAIRAAVQRHAGPHERVDMAFMWPSLAPPQPDAKAEVKTDSVPAGSGGGAAAGPPTASDRLFVTIAGLGGVLPPVERLRSIYPRYLE